MTISKNTAKKLIAHTSPDKSIDSMFFELQYIATN